jgi:hypothetical protein
MLPELHAVADQLSHSSYRLARSRAAVYLDERAFQKDAYENF